VKPGLDYDVLAEKLAWRRHADEGGRYLNVFLEHNNTCNLKCTMCGFSDPRAAAVPRYHMSAELYASIARQLFPLTTYLHMSLMTEPFMTPGFAERLQLVRQYEVPYSRVVTNGTLLTESIVERVIDARITSLAVSIDGGTEELYGSIRTGSRLSNVLARIELFKSVRARRRATLPRLQINHVLMEQNVDHFDAFLALLERIGPDQVDVRTIQPMAYDKGRESVDERFYDKTRALRPLFAGFCRDRGIEDTGFIRDQAGVVALMTQTGARMTCRRPWDTLAIHANGDVQPCMSWTRAPAGNLARQSFEELWSGPELSALRAEFEAAGPGIDCQHCTIKQTVPAGEYDDFFFRMISKPGAA
jgi:radical SAM protein with 4Fe4S-binding SPASM domain